MKIDKYKRHKSTIGYLAAKYIAVLMYILSTIVLFIPYVGVFAWLVAFVFFYLEKDSEMVRLHSAQNGFLLLIYSIVDLLLKVIADVFIRMALSSRSEVAYMNALVLQSHFNTAMRIVALIILILNLLMIFFAYNYRFLNLPGLSKLAKALHDKTKPGPLR